MISYGRDGEKVDAITLQEKPRIYIPPNTVFVTAHNAYKKSDIQADIIARTGIDSLMGEVNIYKSFTKGGYIELVGINSSSRVKKIKEMMPSDIDLTLIDGALDRRSSAMPALTDAFIIATGAVVGNTEDLVIKKTFHEIRRLSLAEVKDSGLRDKAKEFLAKNQDGIVYKDGSSEPLTSETSFGHIKELKNNDKNSALRFNAIVFLNIVILILIYFNIGV